MVFENVGGPVLDLLLERINDGARIALCGMVASYNGGGTQSAQALMRLVTKAARIEGFLVRDHFHRYAEVAAQLQALVLQGRLKYRIDILDGLAQLPLALDNLFHGRNQGVQLLRLAPERGG
jgi:NADPH-dependent curcumin reductase CurA